MSDGPFYVKLDSIPRYVPDGLLCPKCYATGKESPFRETIPTKPEIQEYNCGRSWRCCMTTLLCDVCKYRLPVRLPAPEMD